MTKRSKAFRLSEEAVVHLDTIIGATGSNQTAVVEQALAVYHALLQQGALPRPEKQPQVSQPPAPPRAAPQQPVVEGVTPSQRRELGSR